MTHNVSGMRLTCAADIMDGDWVEEYGLVQRVERVGDGVWLHFAGTVLKLHPNDEVYYS